MAAPRKPRLTPTLDIPVLTEVVESPPETAPSATARTAVITIPQDMLSEMLTERIAALTDRLLRDAAAEIHITLVDKVWEKLREEIPAIVAEALKDNDKE
ncbi:MAG TPA: hypothetical protein VLG68_04560 [Gammaproteobacteria bacterium]|nr:hypothetical protein [Gammaproteobacteria bacterium]